MTMTIDKNIDTLTEKGRKLYNAQRFEEACSVYEEIIKKDPTHANSWANLGTTLRKLGKYEASKACAEKALELKPENPSYLTNYGNILTDLDLKDEALAAHAKAYALKPKDFLINNNYGKALREFCYYERALKHFLIAQDLNPKHGLTKSDIAFTYLYMGNYKDGWEHFESRWLMEEANLRPSKKPRWAGQDLKGKTLLVYTEQGFGDVMLMSRYLPLIHARGVAKILLECKTPLHDLMRTICPDLEIAEYGAFKDDFDFQTPIMSLPLIFQTQKNTIPGPPAFSIPKSPPKKAKALLDKAQDRFKVGICWSGSVTFKNNRKRAVHAREFLPLASIPNVQLFSLQKGPREADLEECGANGLIWELGPHLNSFAETAAVLNELDLVIMTDSSVAHLAGSIGCPVWNMLCYHPYWLYLDHRDDCLWYDSMRLYRQKAPGQWASVFNDVQEDLEKAVLQKKAGLWPWPSQA